MKFNDVQPFIPNAKRIPLNTKEKWRLALKTWSNTFKILLEMLQDFNFWLFA